MFPPSQQSQCRRDQASRRSIWQDRSWRSLAICMTKQIDGARGDGMPLRRSHGRGAVNPLCVQRNGALQHLLFATHNDYVMIRIDQGRNNRPRECGTEGTLL
ncbi:hypothetical protein MESS4_220011 [Mesorhizobium sp. STM 4661]|nr:hypothetical protein MESS4_220011 [Mesorhizobium sp. STM 4661]